MLRARLATWTLLAGVALTSGCGTLSPSNGGGGLFGWLTSRRAGAPCCGDVCGPVCDGPVLEDCGPMVGGGFGGPMVGGPFVSGPYPAGPYPAGPYAGPVAPVPPAVAPPANGLTPQQAIPPLAPAPRLAPSPQAQPTPYTP